MALPRSYHTLTMIKDLKEEFEVDGKHCMGIHLTPEIAGKVRKELQDYYGRDPGEYLMTLFGADVVSIDADEIGFEE